MLFFFLFASEVCPTPVGSQIAKIDNSAASNSFCLDVSLDVVVFLPQLLLRKHGVVC